MKKSLISGTNQRDLATHVYSHMREICCQQVRPLINDNRDVIYQSTVRLFEEINFAQRGGEVELRLLDSRKICCIGTQSVGIVPMNEASLYEPCANWRFPVFQFIAPGMLNSSETSHAVYHSKPQSNTKITVLGADSQFRLQQGTENQPFTLPGKATDGMEFTLDCSDSIVATVVETAKPVHDALANRMSVALEPDPNTGVILSRHLMS